MRNEEKQMKKLTVEYKNYQLVLEVYNTPTDDGYPFTKGSCSDISFVKTGYYEDCKPIIYSFMKNVDYITANKGEEKEFEYKGFVEDTKRQTKRKGGSCEELDYLTFGEDEEANITKFKKYVNWKISEDRKKESSTILQQYKLQLERLALKDKKDEFSPFELRQQLVEISILFSGILDITLEDVKKDYCEIYPTVKYDDSYSVIPSDKAKKNK